MCVCFLLLNFLCNNLLIYLQQLLMQTKYILLYEFTIYIYGIVYIAKERATFCLLSPYLWAYFMHKSFPFVFIVVVSLAAAAAL